MPLILRDKDIAVCDALSDRFDSWKSVSVEYGDIFERPADAVVSPANSFGFMDGGIDAVYLKRFGTRIEDKLRKRIAQRGPMLPIGEVLWMETDDESFPYLLVTPTMIGPSDISTTTNVFVAFHALLRFIRFSAKLDQAKNKIVCPGFGTGVGAMPPKLAAKQMEAAYAAVYRAGNLFPRNSREAHAYAADLVTV